VGFWLKTAAADLQVSFAADESPTAANTERGYFKNVIADGQWHKYEWFLDDVTHWDSFAGGDGKLANIFAADSIQFVGTAASNLIYLDDVFYDAAAIAPNQWVLDANGTWSAGGNWNGPIPNGVGAVANLFRRATGPRTIMLSAPTTLGTLTIDNSSSYTIAGTAQLTMDVASGSASVNVVNRGSHIIAAPFAMADPTNIFVDVGSTLTFSGGFATTGKVLTKTGAGEMIVSGQQIHSSGSTINVNEGKLTLNTNAGVTAQQRLIVNVNNSGVFSLGSTQNLIALNLSSNASTTLTPGASKVLKTNTLSVASLSTLDLNDNDAIVQATAATRQAVLTDVTGWIASARNSIAGRWRGPGITSSIAAGDSRGITTLAAILNDNGQGAPLYTTFDGQSVDINSILVKFTYIGDSDLDGDIDADDYAHLDAGFAGGLGGYGNGDYDYSGSINSDDFFWIDKAFSNQSTPLSALSAALSSVPEPASLALLAAAALVLGRRSGRYSTHEDRISADHLQHLHDLRLVRASEIQAEGAVAGHPGELVDRVRGILFSGARESNRQQPGLHRRAAEDHAGGDYAAGLLRLFSFISARKAEVELSGGVCSGGDGGVLCLLPRLISHPMSSRPATTPQPGRPWGEHRHPATPHRWRPRDGPAGGFRSIARSISDSWDCARR